MGWSTSDDNRLGQLVSFSLEKSRLLGDLRAALQCLKGAMRVLERDFSQDCVVIGKGSNGFKFKESEFRLEILHYEGGEALEQVS